MEQWLSKVMRGWARLFQPLLCMLFLAPGPVKWIVFSFTIWKFSHDRHDAACRSTNHYTGNPGLETDRRACARRHATGGSCGAIATGTPNCPSAAEGADERRHAGARPGYA